MQTGRSFGSIPIRLSELPIVSAYVIESVIAASSPSTKSVTLKKYER